jgi:uncharacterized protein (DUF488 family)
MADRATEPLTVWTIGHSTRTVDELTALLEQHAIEAVIDVRRFPGSRRLPHFQSDALASALATRSIAYCWIPQLGGRRRGDPSAMDTGWRHPAFRAYAAHVLTDEFAEGLFELLMIAHGLRSAIMCAEVLWWRCHRRLIADVLTSLGVDVEHIMNAAKTERHEIAPPARLVDGALTYETI